MAIASALGATAALLIAALLAMTGHGDTKRAASRHSSGPLTLFAAGLAYLLILMPALTVNGMTLPTLVVLFIVVIAPIVAGLATRTLRQSLTGQAAQLAAVANVAVCLGLVSALLAVGGNVLALIGGLNRIVAIAVLAIGVASYLIATGRIGTHRTSRWALAPMLFALVIFLAGAFIGSPEDLVSPQVPFQPLGVGSVVALLLASGAVGVFDPIITLTLRDSRRPARNALIGAGVLASLVAAFGLGMLLIYGGALTAPSVQVFLPFAASPKAAFGLTAFVIVFLVAATADGLLAAGTETAEHLNAPGSRAGLTLALAAAGALIAIIWARPESIFALIAMLGAAALGAAAIAWKRPAEAGSWAGFAAGVIAAAAAAFGVGFDAVLSLTGSTALVLAVAFACSAAGAAVIRSNPTG